MDSVIQSLRSLAIAIVLLSATALFLWLDDADRQTTSKVYRQVYQSILALGTYATTSDLTKGFLTPGNHKAKVFSLAPSDSRIPEYYPALRSIAKENKPHDLCNEKNNIIQCAEFSPNLLTQSRENESNFSNLILDRDYLEKFENLSLECRKSFKSFEIAKNLPLSVFGARLSHDRARPVSLGASINENSLIPINHVVIVLFEPTCGPIPYGYAPVLIPVNVSTQLDKTVKIILPVKLFDYFASGYSVDDGHLNALSVETLIELVVSDAAFKLGKYYPRNPDGLMDAVRDMIALRSAEPSVLGLTVPSKRAHFIFPLAYLLLAFLFFHRARRFEPSMKANQPWLLNFPRGYLEHGAATIWAILLPIAGIPIVQVVLHFDTFPTISDSCANLVRGFPNTLDECLEVYMLTSSFLICIVVAGSIFTALGGCRIWQAYR